MIHRKDAKDAKKKISAARKKNSLPICEAEKTLCALCAFAVKK